MLSSPIILFYSFFILLVFVIGVTPTGIWKRLGAAVSGTAGRARRQHVAAQFARATAAASFTADIDFVPAGIGFAFDRARALLFVAGEYAGRPAEALVPLSGLRAYRTDVMTGGFTDEHYVELYPADSVEPSWRVSCGEDAGSAYAMDRLLSSLGLKKV